MSREAGGGEGGRDEDSKRFHGVSWAAGVPLAAGASLAVRIRHRHPPLPARLTLVRGDEVQIDFTGPTDPGPVVTPGQAAVFYQGDLVLGRGWIESAVGGTA